MGSWAADASQARPNQRPPSSDKARWLSSEEIVGHRIKMAQAVETGALTQVAAKVFQQADLDTNGSLEWNNGEIRDYITQVLSQFGLHPPPESQVYQLYAAFDRDRSGSLELAECLRLVEAIVRAAFNIKFEATQQTTPSAQPATRSLSPAPAAGPSLPLAALATQALPVATGAPLDLHRLRAYRLAEEWVASYSQAVPPVAETSLVKYLDGGLQLDMSQLSAELQSLAVENAAFRSRMIAAVESGALLKATLSSIRLCDRDGNGYLTWNNGDIQDFVSTVFRSHGMSVPSQEQIYRLYTLFDGDQKARLDPRECVCLVDAIVRAVFFESCSVQGAPKAEAATYAAVEEWLANFSMPALGTAVTYFKGHPPIQMHVLAVQLRSLANVSALQRGRMIKAVESGELLKVALQTFRSCDRDRSGSLTWNNGEIRNFIGQVLQQFGMAVPTEAQIYELYSLFDADDSASLDVREGVCLVDAAVRAAFHGSELASEELPEAARANHAPASPSAGQGPDHRLEHLLRTCGDLKARGQRTAQLKAMLVAWHRAARDAAWSLQLEALKAAADKAQTKLKEEQVRFEVRLQEELGKRKRLDTSTMSARLATEAECRAEEVAETRFSKERLQWEARLKDERERRVRAEAAHGATAAEAATQAEEAEAAELRFSQERDMWESRLKEERERRVRLEASHATTLDEWAAQSKKLRRSAARAALESMVPRVKAQGLLARTLKGWCSHIQAKAARRKQSSAVDLSVASWLRKSAGGMKEAAFGGWSRIVQSKRQRQSRTKAAISCLERQWLEGARGLLASYLGEWQKLSQEKVQRKALADRRAKAHASVALVVKQWERGSAAGLLAAVTSAWKIAVDASARKRSKA
ncbi:unnamed protein product, partial [Polarella glacialis]